MSVVSRHTVRSAGDDAGRPASAEVALAESLRSPLGDLSYDEIAFALSIPKGTVGSRLSRARRKLTRALHDVHRADISEPPSNDGRNGGNP
jgi:hypothetical protein